MESETYVLSEIVDPGAPKMTWREIVRERRGTRWKRTYDASVGCVRDLVSLHSRVGTSERDTCMIHTSVHAE